MQTEPPARRNRAETLWRLLEGAIQIAGYCAHGLGSRECARSPLRLQYVASFAQQ